MKFSFCMLSREKRPMLIAADGLAVTVAELHPSVVYVTRYLLSNGFVIHDMPLEFEIFDGLLELIIQFGRE